MSTSATRIKQRPTKRPGAASHQFYIHIYVSPDLYGRFDAVLANERAISGRRGVSMSGKLRDLALSYVEQAEAQMKEEGEGMEGS